jgi:hypothetical protein
MSMTSQCEFAFRLIDEGACLGTSSDGVFLFLAANQLFIESIEGVPRRGFEACQEMVKAEALRRNGTCKLNIPPPDVPPPGDGVEVPPVIPPPVVPPPEDGEMPPMTVFPPLFPGELIPGVPNDSLVAGIVAASAVGIGLAVAVGSGFIQLGRGL